MTPKERWIAFKAWFWPFFYYWRDCLRQYAAKNALSITLIAIGGILTWAWILFVNVVTK